MPLAKAIGQVTTTGPDPSLAVLNAAGAKLGRVKLNPVWLMFALFAFGYLFGFVGLLIAIPLAASLGVILRFAMRKSLASPEADAAPTSPDLASIGPKGDRQTLDRPMPRG